MIHSSNPLFVAGILWILFWAYWLISAFSSKRTVRTNALWSSMLMRVVFIILFIVLFRMGRLRDLPALPANPNPMIDVLGILLCAAGMAFAVWARIRLGRNWGVPMSIKENPELVTTGPYRFVRHPIYAGMLVAILGTTLLAGGQWFLVFFFFLVYFGLFAVRKEEQFLSTQFPAEYPAYAKRTKRLIPFVW